nr:hypothetical protein [Tanacetum cinerariifolium]
KPTPGRSRMGERTTQYIMSTSDHVKGKYVGNKMHKAFPLPVIEFPLAEEVPTASEESCHCQKKRKFPLLPGNVATTGSASDGTGKKKGRTITLTTDDMQKRNNDVKAITTLLLSLPDEHQL